MALDGKAIKEEIPDKEVYDSGTVRRAKGEFFFNRSKNISNAFNFQWNSNYGQFESKSTCCL